MNSNDPFHTVGSLFLGEIKIEQVSPETPIAEALKLMRMHRFSQLPVVENGAIRGIFSLSSLAQYFIEASGKRIQEPLVEDAMEQIPSVKVTDSLHDILFLLEQHEALLVESPQGPQAIMTASDPLKYFYEITKAFILIQEIELALRDLISSCTGTLLDECIKRSLSYKYKEGRALPTALIDLTFDEYQKLICEKENWKLFDGVLGRNRGIVSVKLENVTNIRNEVMHFRSDVDVTTTVYQHMTLSATRNWLLSKTERLRQRAGGVQKGTAQ